MELATTLQACLLAILFVHINAVTQKVCASTKKDADCKIINNDASELVRCEQVETNTDCLLKLNSKNATFGRFETEEAVVAAAFNTRETFRVVAEIRHTSRQNEKYAAKMVVLVPATFKGGLNELRNATYCHPGLNREKYWTDAIWQTFEDKINETRTCTENSTYIEERTVALSGFFSKACRPGAWTADSEMDKHLKNKYPNLCALCDDPSKCKYQSNVQHPSLSCLTQKRASVAIAFLQDVRTFFSQGVNPPTPTIPSVKASDYKFLCPGFSTQEIDFNQDVCAWVTQPWPAVVAVDSEATAVSELLKDSLKVRGRPQVDDALRDILRGDEEWAIHLDQASFPTVGDYVRRSRVVPNPITTSCYPEIRLCASNRLEADKCQVLSAAVQTHGIAPSLSCVQGQNVFDCFKRVNTSEADIVSVPTNLGFIARGTQKLVSSRFIDDLEHNLGIAVVKTDSTIKRVKDIKGKSACFPAFNNFGYMTFMEAAYESSLVGKSWCPLSDSTVKIFSEACAPGVTNPLYAQTPASENTTLCSACFKGRIGGSCAAIVSNPYFGDAGAVRCLASDAGQVAFVEYHAYSKFMNGAKTGEDTSIDPANFRILCNNGSTVSDIDLSRKDDLANCVLLKVMKTEVLTRQGQTKKRERDIQRFLADLDDWFGLNNHYSNIIGLYGKFLGQENVLFPTEGIGIAVEKTDILENYSDLQQRLQHCNSSNRTVVTLISLLTMLLSLLL